MAEPDLSRRLTEIRPFDEVPADVLADLRGHLSARSLGPGEPLFIEGGKTGKLAVVITGRLAVRIGAGVDAFEVAQIGDGEVVGEISALLGGDRTAVVTAATDCEVIMVSDGGVVILVDRAPSVVEHLVRTATRRLRETQLAAALESHFGPGPDRNRHPFVDSVEWVSLKAGERLFTKGEEADAAYVLVSGRLRELDDQPTPASPPTEIGAGELVGAMTLLRSAPRTLTVAATRDSTLARLPRDAFDRLATEHPESMLAVVRTLLDGLLDPQVPRRPSALTIVVLGVNPAIDVHGFATRLASHLSRVIDTLHLWAGCIDDRFERDGIANSPRDTPGDLRVRYWLDDAEQDHEVVLLETDPEWTPWTRRALGQADHVLILADATVPDVSAGPLESAVYNTLSGSSAPPRTTLVLLHPPGAENPRNTARWLEGRSVTDHLHVRRDSEEHLGRLARIVSGRAISVVLSGGGARGFAHLGVIRAMRELEIPVDMVAAASIGAPLSISVAMEFSDAELVERSGSYFAGVKDYTIPVVAVLRGRAITRQIAASTEGRDFEDCWIPFFCVSTSLTSFEDVVHRRGPMAPAIRASVSIPGVLPPVALDGDLLIDGASSNNLPVDRMREANPTGTIIAIDVSRVEAVPTMSDFAPHISGWAALVSRLKRVRQGSSPPGIGATLIASSLVGANRVKTRQLHEQIADLYIVLDVQGLGMLDFSPENARLGATIGYEASFAQLRAWRDEHFITSATNS